MAQTLYKFKKADGTYLRAAFILPNFIKYANQQANIQIEIVTIKPDPNIKYILIPTVTKDDGIFYQGVMPDTVTDPVSITLPPPSFGGGGDPSIQNNT